MSYPLEEVNKRRTFAIISHPDAGKTTITEKVLLYGNAIQKPAQKIDPPRPDLRPQGVHPKGGPQPPFVWSVSRSGDF